MRNVYWAVVVASVGSATLVASPAERRCEKVIGQLATEFIYKVPNERSPRVEIRQCSPNDSATIQLVAWRSGDATPALVINTEDFGVVQTAARANVFVVETGGATRDQVFVIVYDRGEPRLALKRTTKGTARIRIDASAVNLIIDGIYAGDAPSRTESRQFPVDEEAMKRQ